MYPSNPLEMSSFVAFYTIKLVITHIRTLTILLREALIFRLSAGAAPCRVLTTQTTVVCQATEGGVDTRHSHSGATSANTLLIFVAFVVIVDLRFSLLCSYGECSC